MPTVASPVGTRIVSHSALIRKQQLNGGHENRKGYKGVTESEAIEESQDNHKSGTENPAVQKGKIISVTTVESGLNSTAGYLNLFIDLLWVGIVSNISERFSSTAFHSDTTWGSAFLEFSVLFYLAWRVWNDLRKVPFTLLQ
jgi:uncharacterized protein YqfA (UPF0365 family)